MIDTLNRHFATDGLAFHAPRPDAWFVDGARRTCRSRPSRSRPCEARSSRTCRAATHGETWRRWLSEMQMLLHEHPVNAAREAAGRAPVTGIWVSGGGALPRDADAAPHGAFTRRRVAPATSREDSHALRGLRDAAAPPSFAACRAACARRRSPPSPAKMRSHALARDWLDPAVAALETARDRRSSRCWPTAAERRMRAGDARRDAVAGSAARCARGCRRACAAPARISPEARSAEGRP